VNLVGKQSTVLRVDTDEIGEGSASVDADAPTHVEKFEVQTPRRISSSASRKALISSMVL
jgi:hypothetical protein